jgi:DNA invertase Pin-like site-specific DNA recombinase
MFVRAYLRASTTEQDATRAKDQLKAFATERGLTVRRLVCRKRERREAEPSRTVPPLADAHPGDILLVEQLDRLSRLTATDWKRLKAELTARRLRVVALGSGLN